MAKKTALDLDFSEFENKENETEQPNVTVKRNTNKETSNDFINSFKQKKQTIEDTHTRDTFLVRNDLRDRFNKQAAKQGRGFKTHFLNHVLEKGLDELEGK